MVIDVDFDHLAKVVQVSPLDHWLLWYLPVHKVLWKEVTMHSTQLRSGELCSPSFIVEQLHNLFEILLHGRYLLLRLLQIWSLKTLSCLLCPFDVCHLCVVFKMVQANFVYFPCQSQNQPFLQEPWLLLLEYGFRPKSGCQVCSSLISQAFLTEQGNMSTCVFTHMYKYFHIYHLNLYVKCEFLLMFPTLIHYHVDHFSFLCLLICTSSLQL